MTQPVTILCITSFEKGADLMRECHALGARVLLLTVESLRNVDWPRPELSDIYFMPSLYERDHVINAVSYLARSERITSILALDELNVEMAGALREHLRLPGMNDSQSRLFRDKLAMRVKASADGVRVPPFTRLFPYEDVARFVAEVPPPWVLKPRTEASAVGIRKIDQPETVWRTLEELGDAQSYHLIEQFIAGDVYHVDSITVGGRIVFAEAHRYHKPPFDVYHGGGMFRTSTIPRDSDAERALRELTQRIGTSLGMERGIMHTEFIRGAADGRVYFLETACRVGGAYINEMVEAASGINLWREWGRLEVLAARGEPYSVTPLRQNYGGVIMSLAKQEWPDTSAYNDAEIVYRIHKANHVGFVLRSNDHDRVISLLDSYAQRFLQDFHASMPPQKTIR
jgi:biotin carboxylase